MSLLELAGIHQHRRLLQYAYVLRRVLERFEILPLDVGSFGTLFDEHRLYSLLL
jgi:hypothetical protein